MNLAEKNRRLVIRSAEDTNLSDCIASAEEDQNIIWGRGKSWMTLKAERNRWIFKITKSKTLHLETKVEACWLKI